MGDSKKRNQSRSKKKNPSKEAKKRRLSQLDANQTVTDQALPSTSAKKLRQDRNNAVISGVEVNSSSLGNALVNMDLLISFIERFKCTICQGSISVNSQNLGGLAQRLIAVCELCGANENQDLSNLLTGMYNKIIFVMLFSVEGDSREGGRVYPTLPGDSRFASSY